MAALLLAAVAAAGAAVRAGAGTTTHAVIDPGAPGLPYDGHGGLSAGASSRLLYDYPEPQRSEVLDYLYKPRFGANLHICKVEIGGDTQSTDGTEPSHMHDREDLNCTRGYEWWLMREAKMRNPDIITYGLPWGAPGWINNQTGYYGPDQITYQVNWLKCARDHHGIDVDWLGLWNERPWGTPDFVKSLRNAIDAEGMKTRLVLGDGGMPDVMKHATDAEFLSAFDAVGLHYPCEASKLGGQGPALLAAGKKVWSSEDWWSEAEWPGAACWAKLFNQNFIRMNLTSTISWSTVWSVYPSVDVFEGSGDTISGDGFWGPGLMYAWQPWSGHYVVPPTVWASAHTCQFASPGWKMPFSAAGDLAGGGSFVTFVSPDGADFATVVETGVAKCNHCGYAPSTASTAPQQLSVALRGALARHARVDVWRTGPNQTFEKDGGGVPVVGGAVTLTVPPESIVTVTSTTGQARGAHPAPPPSAPFPSSLSDSFDAYPDEGLARFFADQCGSWQVVRGDAGGTLRQRVAERPGANKWGTNLNNPLTVAGSYNASDVTVSADVLLPSAAAARAAPPAAFVYKPGRITGGAYDEEKVFDSVAAAEQYCTDQPRCNAFTFSSADKAPAGAVNYWFTSKMDVDPGQAGWQSYVLAHPKPPPPAPWARFAGVCGRISSCGRPPAKAVCLHVNETAWQLTEDDVQIAEGPTGGARASGWRTLQLALRGATATASVDGAQVGAAPVRAARGMAGLTSGWHPAGFDNFHMASL